MSNGLVFCRACGGSVHSSAPFCPHCGAPQRELASGDGIPRSFGNSISICFRKYAEFNGRAPRAEFWWFSLFQVLVQWGSSLMAAMSDSGGASAVSGVVSLVFLCPSIAVSVRRLHDLDRSGWWWLLAFIPVIGWIVLIVWDCTRGTRGENRFGPENGAI